MIYTHSVLFLRTNIGDSHTGRRLLGKCSSRDSYLHFTGTSPIQWQCNMNYLLWWLMARPSGELPHPPLKHCPTILFGPIENMGLLHLPLPQFFKVQPWTNCYKALAIEWLTGKLGQHSQSQTQRVLAWARFGGIIPFTPMMEGSKAFNLPALLNRTLQD